MYGIQGWQYEESRDQARECAAVESIGSREVRNGEEVKVARGARRKEDPVARRNRHLDAVQHP